MPTNITDRTGPVYSEGMKEPRRPSRGRYREAAENDTRILAAATRVFTSDPEAPISAVGTAAGVGKSALYSRYASKQDLLMAVGEHLTEVYVGIVETALARLNRDEPPVQVLSTFLADAADAGVHAMMLSVAGRFEPTAHDRARSADGWRAGEQLVGRLRDAGALRTDVTWLDLNKLLEGLGAIRSPQPEREQVLRQRFAVVVAAGLGPSASALPGGPTLPTDFGQ